MNYIVYNRILVGFDNLRGGYAVKKLITVILLFFLSLSSMAWTGTTDEWGVKGSHALENGNYDEAIRCYNQAIAKDPDNVSTHYNLGWAYYKKGLNVLAADYFYSAGLLFIKQGHGESMHFLHMKI